MKKTLSLILFCFYNAAFSMEVNSSTGFSMDQIFQLPSQETINTRLNAPHLQHIVKQTNIDKQFGGQETTLAALVMNTDTALTSYYQTTNHQDGPNSNATHPLVQRMLSHKAPSEQQISSRKAIVHALLLDDPEAIKELRNRRILD